MTKAEAKRFVFALAAADLDCSSSSDLLTSRLSGQDLTRAEEALSELIEELARRSGIDLDRNGPPPELFSDHVERPKTGEDGAL